MGECCSKEEDLEFSATTPGRTSMVENNEFSDRSVIKDDEKNVENLRREFREAPSVFLLNNLLMTVQFFEDSRKDREQFLSTTSKIEKDLNITLLENESMECICPDTTFEIVNNNLRFRPFHGPKKRTSESLLPRRMFIVNDTIEVVNCVEMAQYTSIDKPAYQVSLEESSRKGFVRLKQIDTNKIPKIYARNPDQPGPSGLQTPVESDYIYTTITDLQTPKPLERIDPPERRDTLPVTCFVARKIRKPSHEIIDLQNEEIELTEEDLFDNIIYIDAKGFMNYIKNAVFPHSLGRSLGFTEHEIEFTKSIPGKIFCNLTDDDDNPIPCEVIPSVAIDWPDEQTFEFIMREDRPTITDNITGIRYRWPTDQMLKEMRTFKCVAVPKGYWKKKGTYSDATIEWEIALPKAERYLEARMSNAQIRCYLFLLILHRTFIDPVTHQNGLLIEHIRCHMYWECEKNYRDWPEHRLGTKILKVIENLNKHLSKSELPDYFIKQKNHFRNIPQKYLHFAQKIFHSVLQNPVVYFIRALRNVRYASGKFYPPFDFKEFYRILTETQSYRLVNPNLRMGTTHFNKNNYIDPDMQWEHLREMTKRKKVLQQRKIEDMKLERDDTDTASVDSINLDWTCEKQFEFFKTSALLKLFIKTFIAIAKCVSKFGGTEKQTMLYLKQASYLTKILETTSPSLKPEVREFTQQINAEQEAVQKSAVLRISDIPPATPVRNSIQFDYSISQQVKNNVLNLNNLHNSYNGEVKSTVKINKNTPILRIKSDVSGYKKNTGGPRKSVAFVEPKPSDRSKI